MKAIYLDNASATPIDSRVQSEMQKYFSDCYGNPESLHELGKSSKKSIENARETIAKIINSSADEIIFTSGGTESINLAIIGVAKAMKNKGKHIITTQIEHPAVLETCKALEKEGFSITLIKPNANGIVSPREIEQEIKNDTIIVSVMLANNEIGTIQPISEIGKICRSRNVYFHSDACQAGGILPINVNELNVDLLTLNSSKFYGPKGCGILYVRHGTIIEPIIYGGGQERRLRAGTENVPAIVGFAKALEIAYAENYSNRITSLRNKLITELLEISGAEVNGDRERRLPGNASVRFKGVEAESVLLHLSRKGIYASTGSACSSRKLEPSHVLLAIGLSPQQSHETLRFTIGKHTSEEDIENVLNAVKDIVNKLRTERLLN